MNVAICLVMVTKPIDSIPLAHWQFDGDTIFPLPSAQPDMHGWKNLLEAAWEM